MRLRPCEPLTAPAGRSLLRRLPLPIRCDCARGPLIPTLRPDYREPRGAPGRAWDPGRPRHPLPVGAAVHAAACRSRPARPISCGRSLAGRRDVVRVAGRWQYVDRAIDQFGQVIDVFVSSRRDTKAAHRFFEPAIATTKITPAEVTTDQAPVYPGVLDDLLPAAWHRTDRYANNRVEGDHGRLRARGASDARAQTGPQRQGDHRRTRLRAEPSPRPLRAGG